MKQKADKAQLTIRAEERLSQDRIGVDLLVKVLDDQAKPISGHPFIVQTEGQVLLEGLTDERGEYSGQRVISLQNGTKQKLFLTLEETSVTDWKVVGEQDTEREEAIDVCVKIIDPDGKPLPDIDLKVQVNDVRLVDATTDLSGEYRREIISRSSEGTRRQVFIVLEAPGIQSAPPPKVDPKPEQLSESEIKYVLLGTRVIKMGEVCRLKKEKYTVGGDIKVEEGGTLIIEPGSILEMTTTGGIICKGHLNAVGTKKEPITFRQATKDGWQNITLFGAGAAGSTLRFCLIEGGKGRHFSKGLAVESLQVTASGSPESKNVGGGLLLLDTDSDFQDIETTADSDRIHVSDVVIRNNTSGFGSAIYCYKSSPIIARSLMTGNNVTNPCGLENSKIWYQSHAPVTPGEYEGGVVFAERSKPKVNFSRIINSRGSGILLRTAEAEIESCLIEGNSSGGVHVLHGSKARILHSKIGASRCGILVYQGSSLEIVDSKVTDNSNGGIGVSKGSLLNMARCEVTGNVSIEGGGLRISDGSAAEISDSTIAHNRTQLPEKGFRTDNTPGGGIYAHASKIRLVNCIISGNTGEAAGSISVNNSDLTIDHSRVEENSGRNAALWISRSTVKIVDSDISSNQQPSNRSGQIICIASSMDMDSLVTLERSMVQGRRIELEVLQRTRPKAGGGREYSK